MPELPEVQTVVNELKSDIEGLKISSIQASYKPCLKLETGLNTDEFLHKAITKVFRRCKFIAFEFADGSGILTHLRMTGKYVFELNENDKKHAHVSLVLSNGRKLYYCDVRKFGGLEFTINLDERLAKLGCEPLSGEFNKLSFGKYLAQSNRSAKALLLEQSFVCGIGNIYADESLFLAGIHPATKGKLLTAQQVNLLVKKIKLVLQKSIDNMGTTLSDYRTTKNTAGENQNYLYVYGQDGKACKVCETIIEKIKLAGRGTHFCKRCQELLT